VPSSRAAAAPSEADAREAEFAGALLELADGAAPDDALPGAAEADGSHAQLTALAVHARHRLAREGRACETAALLDAPSE
ncbi:hypothetical protein, partial [Streptomyces sp. GSL17-113]|uniref:hypothetical protein n=1 Tax=Streptomyces sp. GSL17-113 TaxID=3115365 RepID=UPI002E790CA2